jgi:DNA processing protein
MVINNDTKYLISFTRIAGIGRVKISQLRSYFGTLEDAWKATSGELSKAGIDSKTVTSITNSRSKIHPEAEIEILDKFKVTVIESDSPSFPARLKEIYDCPPLIYVRGNLLPEDECCLAVVGTRRASIYGRQVTEELVADLVRNNITIVSGLAKGIDSIAHRTALDVQGRTIAVFASGLDIAYPAENAKLAREIMENGALISEYPLGIKPKADNFPRRNRILSGLSLGVLVIEAGERSGALITADLALSQNREVFAVPGSIFSPVSKGTNKLLQQGAKLVQSNIDVLEELNLAMVAQQLEMKDLLPMDSTESLLLKNISAEPIHINEICRQSGLTSAIVNSTLTMMELKGLIKQIGGMNYIRVREMREEYQVRAN